MMASPDLLELFLIPQAGGGLAGAPLEPGVFVVGMSVSNSESI